MNTTSILKVVENARVNATNANNTVQYLKQRLEQTEQTVSTLHDYCAQLEQRMRKLEQQLEDDEE